MSFFLALANKKGGRWEQGEVGLEQGGPSGPSSIGLRHATISWDGWPHGASHPYTTHSGFEPLSTSWDESLGFSTSVRDAAPMCGLPYDTVDVQKSDLFAYETPFSQDAQSNFAPVSNNTGHAQGANVATGSFDPTVSVGDAGPEIQTTFAQGSTMPEASPANCDATVTSGPPFDETTQVENRYVTYPPIYGIIAELTRQVNMCVLFAEGTSKGNLSSSGMQDGTSILRSNASIRIVTKPSLC